MCGNNNQKLDLLLAFSIADTKQDHYFVPETVDTGVDTRIVPIHSIRRMDCTNILENSSVIEVVTPGFIRLYETTIYCDL